MNWWELLLTVVVGIGIVYFVARVVVVYELSKFFANSDTADETSKKFSKKS